MGQLWYPFVAASAALMVAGLLFGPSVFYHEPRDMQVIYGLLAGALSSVVLYAIMRSIAARQKQ